MSKTVRTEHKKDHISSHYKAAYSKQEITRPTVPFMQANYVALCIADSADLHREDLWKLKTQEQGQWLDCKINKKIKVIQRIFKKPVSGNAC